jgi:hypothetical protein
MGHRWLSLTGLVGLLALPAEVGAGARRIPNMPAGWTWPPSQAMRDAGAKCLEALDAEGIAWSHAPATKRVVTPVVLASLQLGEIELEPTYRKPPFVMDCHLARALAAHAADMRAVGVAALRFSTIHDYRRIRVSGKRRAILSRHAIGLAIDVPEVVLVDGSVLDVKSQYAAGHPVLHALEAVLSGADDLRTPLTPGNDPKSHDDHFHLEAQMPIDAPAR